MPPKRPASPLKPPPNKIRRVERERRKSASGGSPALPTAIAVLEFTGDLNLLRSSSTNRTLVDTMPSTTGPAPLPAADVTPAPPATTHGPAPGAAQGPLTPQTTGGNSTNVSTSTLLRSRTSERVRQAAAQLQQRGFTGLPTIARPGSPAALLRRTSDVRPATPVSRRSTPSHAVPVGRMGPPPLPLRQPPREDRNDTERLQVPVPRGRARTPLPSPAYSSSSRRSSLSEADTTCTTQAPSPTPSQFRTAVDRLGLDFLHRPGDRGSSSQASPNPSYNGKGKAKATSLAPVTSSTATSRGTSSVSLPRSGLAARTGNSVSGPFSPAAPHSVVSSRDVAYLPPAPTSQELAERNRLLELEVARYKKKEREDAMDKHLLAQETELYREALRLERSYSEGLFKLVNSKRMDTERGEGEEQIKLEEGAMEEEEQIGKQEIWQHEAP